MNAVYILGVGHNTPVLVDLAKDCGYEVLGLYHYNSERTGERIHDIEIIGSFDNLFSKGNLGGKNYLLSMGDNKIRSQLCDKILSLNGRVPSVIHPSSIISHYTEKNDTGVSVGPFCNIQADTKIGRNTMILSGVQVCHTSTIGNSCFIAGGSIIGAYTEVEDYVFIGQGVLTISSKVSKIGHHAFVGAGSLVTKEVLPYNVVYGHPAKMIKVLDNDLSLDA